MKNIWKKALLLCVVACSAAFLAGCTPDEELNLPGYKGAAVGVSIVGTQGDVQVTLNGIYDDTGALLVDGIASRDYVISLPTVSHEDVVLSLEPIIVNIPTENVTISAKELVIPAGFSSATVNVSLLNDDFTFAQSERASQVYELGVKITGAQGYDVALMEPEAKVILKKEAYVANCSLAGVDGDEVTIARTYGGGQILDKDPMTYEIKAYLDKPATSDVVVTLTASGLAEPFMKDMSVTPATLTIPAGSLESATAAVWTATDDFLLTTDGPEKHTVLVTPSVSSEDPTVKANEKSGYQTINIIKNLEAVAQVDALSDDWSKFDRAGWLGVGGGEITYGSADGLLHNSEVDGKHFWLDIDMLDVKNIAGFSLRAYSSTYACKNLAFHISDDNKVWTCIGTLNPTQLTTQYFKTLGAISTRYLRLEIIEGYTGGYYQGQTWLMDFNVYGPK